MTEPRRLLPYGPDAALVECPDGADAAALHRWLRDEHPGADSVPGARTVLVRLLPDADLREQLLSARRDPAASEDDQDPLTVPVDYDGPDLPAVAAHLGIDTSEVVARHTGRRWTVAFGGFLPGFGYLVPADDSTDLVVPRRDSPRTAVPAGSVGLAGQWSGIYPRSSPGGWQLIGRTDLTLFDPDRDPPALLAPGRTVRFENRR